MQIGNSIKAKSLVEQIIDGITEAIIDGRLKPGDRLPTENELAESFQVGKSSIREATKILQALGIVEVRRGEGTFVGGPTNGNTLNPALYQMMLEPEPIDKLMEMRLIFEPEYSVLAMRRATDEDKVSIKEAKERYEQLVREGKQRGRDDIAFHRSILKATHTPYIIRIGEMILQILLQSIDKGCTSAPEISMRDHERIFDAFIEGDEGALRQAVLDSFEYWIKNN